MSVLQFQHQLPDILQDALVEVNLLLFDVLVELVRPVFQVLGLLAFQLLLDQVNKKGVDGDVPFL